ncbi:UNVERIFIED_CONTAM: hypothetical protein FKN15_031060 [Acipenser sinensis]
MIPATFPARARTPATPCGVLESRNTIPVPSLRAHVPTGLSDPVGSILSMRTGAIDSVRGHSSLPNVICHLAAMRTSPSHPVRGPRGSLNDTCYLSNAGTDASDPVWGPSSSPNNTCHLPSVRTGLSDPMRVPAARQTIPSAHT